MFDLLKVRPARRAAYSALEPFVHRSADGRAGLEAGAWLQPQIIGFLATVVTLIAERTCGELRTHALASVQASVLTALTGIGPELIGEEICLLSSRRDAAFMAGSFGAVAFLEAMDVVRTPPSGDVAVLEELWSEHVERHIKGDQPFI
ncbi:hypothetical protein DWF00_23405 [Bosea caraganae]|uniref:Uncharacterized protein n=1 Tax=Bosea caraganae TaxID=2763117 RepID=A0A370L270_9HYPH|nr:hypothetical protein [Bosea caraganae]RDJ22208.1 hypothetical protein DWE98_20140 [Bosea caraganae]RDJ22705.1 hypothetical protein DWF00_23405 [Bosea caraganae]